MSQGSTQQQPWLPSDAGAGQQSPAPQPTVTQMQGDKTAGQPPASAGPVQKLLRANTPAPLRLPSDSWASEPDTFGLNGAATPGASTTPSSQQRSLSPTQGQNAAQLEQLQLQLQLQQQQQQQQPQPQPQQQVQQAQQPQPERVPWLGLLPQLECYTAELGLKPAGVWPADHPEPCPLCQLPRSEQMAVVALLGCKLPGWREQLLQQQGNVGMWQRAVQLMDRYSGPQANTAGLDAPHLSELPQEEQLVVSVIRGRFLPALDWLRSRRQYAFWQDKLCQLHFYSYELGLSDVSPVAPAPPCIRLLATQDATAVLELLNIERMPPALQLRQLPPLPQWELVLEEQQGMWVAALQLVRAYSTAAAVQDAPNLEDLPMRELDALREIINWQE